MRLKEEGILPMQLRFRARWSKAARPVVELLREPLNNLWMLAASSV